MGHAQDFSEPVVLQNTKFAFLPSGMPMAGKIEQLLNPVEDHRIGIVLVQAVCVIWCRAMHDA
jgi:hypothetical protein